LSGWNQEQEYQAGVRDERERLIKVFVERYPTHIVEVIDIGMGETYKSHDNCPQCVAVALIKGESK
jgi:hypothetical protein